MSVKVDFNVLTQMQPAEYFGAQCISPSFLWFIAQVLPGNKVVLLLTTQQQVHASTAPPSHSSPSPSFSYSSLLCYSWSSKQQQQTHFVECRWWVTWSVYHRAHMLRWIHSGSEWPINLMNMFLDRRSQRERTNSWRHANDLSTWFLTCNLGFQQTIWNH